MPSAISVTPYGFDIGSTERQQLRFDFAPDLEAGETISSVTSVTVVNFRTDADVSLTALDGAATISTAKVLQWVHDLEAGQTYIMTVTVTTSHGELRAAEQKLICER